MKKILAAVTLSLISACAPLKPAADASKAERITITKDGPVAATTEKRVKGGDASTLASAKQGDAATLKEANAYTDSKIAGIEQAPKAAATVVPPTVVTPTVVTANVGRVFTMTYEVSKLKVGTDRGDYQAIRVVPFDAKITTGSVSENSWATGIGGGANSGFIITRVSDGKQFMVMSSSTVGPGTYRPAITEDMDLKAGDQIGIEQVKGSGSNLSNLIINLYFSKQ